MIMGDGGRLFGVFECRFKRIKQPGDGRDAHRRAIAKAVAGFGFCCLYPFIKYAAIARIGIAWAAAITALMTFLILFSLIIKTKEKLQ